MSINIKKLIEGIKWAGLVIIIIAIWLNNYILDVLATLLFIFLSIDIIKLIIKNSE